ncbi:MAG: YeeE/YedE thiosulfate transporter family protein [Haloferacaceae archaeon]
MTGLLVAVAIGAALGTLFHRGRICYASALSDSFLFGSSRTGGGILIATLATTLAYGSVYAIRGDAGFYLTSWGWFSLVGGVVFGAGMILAGACLTSALWRAAIGRGQYALVLSGVVAGFLATASVQDALARYYFAPLWLGGGRTLYGLEEASAPLIALVVVAGTGVAYAAAVGSTKRRLGAGPSNAEGRRPAEALAVGGRTVVRSTLDYLGKWLSRPRLRDVVQRPWDPRTCGLGIAAVATVWLLQYGAWTVSGPVERWLALGVWTVEPGVLRAVPGLASTFPGEVTPDMAVVTGFVGGAFLSSLATGDFEATPPTRRGSGAAVGGGLLMGCGAMLAPGCNVTNLYTGVALLSVHGLLAGAGILLGSYLTTRSLF